MRPTLLLLATLCSAPAFAQSPVINNASIDSSGAQYQGNMAVNQAAGDFSQQANARALANGHGASATTQKATNTELPMACRNEACCSTVV